MVLNQSLQRIQSKDCLIEVYGLGYVGLPLALRIATSGYSVLGVDSDSKKIQSLQNNSLEGSHSSLKSLLSKSLEKGNFSLSTESTKSESTKIGIICVPTPVSDEDSNVYVFKALQNFLDTAKLGDVLVLESSIRIGTTDKVSQIIESKGFKIGEDFGLCFCPERIDPLNQKWKLENIPRIIYTSDDVTFQIAQNVYQHVNHSKLHKVDTAEIAEVVKSFENAFRLVNISLVNELAILCEKLKINVKDVLDAAATKPFGFMPFYPGAGAGGHCIPKDPTFLSESAKKMGTSFSSIENAISINSLMPNYITNSIEKVIEEQNLEKSVLVCGLSYKPDTEDMRDSPGFKILYELDKQNFKVGVYDPHYKPELSSRYLAENHLKELEYNVLENLDDDSISKYNCICIVQHHSKTKSRVDEIYKNSLVPFIYDCQNKIPIIESKTILKRLGNE